MVGILANDMIALVVQWELDWLVYLGQFPQSLLYLLPRASHGP